MVVAVRVVPGTEEPRTRRCHGRATTIRTRRSSLMSRDRDPLTRSHYLYSVPAVPGSTGEPPLIRS